MKTVAKKNECDSFI